MDLRRLRVGEWIAAISGVVLIASLFLPWWSVPEVEGAYFDSAGDREATTRVFHAGDVAWSAWDALSTIDVLLALLGLMGIAVWVIVARATAAAPGVAAEALIVPFALVMSAVCLIRVLNTPGDFELPAMLGFEASVEYGAWIGLAAAWGVLVGVLVGLRDERLSRPGDLTDTTGVPVERPVEVEKLPAPPPA